MKKLLLILILFGGINLCNGQQNDYISLSQLENAMNKDWEFLHEILEAKKWIFFERKVINYPGGDQRIGYEYYLKKGVKDSQIILDNNYEKDYRHIILNIYDEDYYFYLKNQLKQKNYKVLGPSGYTNDTYRIFIHAHDYKSEEWGNTTYFSFSIHFDSDVLKAVEKQ